MGSTLAISFECSLAWTSGRVPLPPMGWMDWEIYRCDISEELIRNTTDAMVAGGWLQAGYDTVHIDDCWANKVRDSQDRLEADPSRFPSGMKALVDYVHAKGMKLGIYSAAAPLTCAKFQPGSQGYEAIDAQTFIEWGVDYLKFDGCQTDPDALRTSYRAMGAALRDAPIVYSCSWGVRGGTFPEMVDAGCDMWRMWHDLQAKKGWGDVVRISDHWANSADAWRNWSGPPSSGRGWHDPDMLLAGDEHLTVHESIAQLGVWSILSAPLIMGNRLFPDALNPDVVAAYQNPEIIDIARDALTVMGGRLGEADDNQEVWARPLTDGALAVLLWNKATPDVCTWNVTANTSSGNSPSRIVEFKKAYFDYTKMECCADPNCKHFTFTATNDVAAAKGIGMLYGDMSEDAWRITSGVARYSLRTRAQPEMLTRDLTLNFDLLQQVGLWNASSATVRNVLERTDLGLVTGVLTAKRVPAHGIALFKFVPPSAVVV